MQTNQLHCKSNGCAIYSAGRTVKCCVCTRYAWEWQTFYYATHFLCVCMFVNDNFICNLNDTHNMHFCNENFIFKIRFRRRCCCCCCCLKLIFHSIQFTNLHIRRINLWKKIIFIHNYRLKWTYPSYGETCTFISLIWVNQPVWLGVMWFGVGVWKLVWHWFHFEWYGFQLDFGLMPNRIQSIELYNYCFCNDTSVNHKIAIIIRFHTFNKPLMPLKLSTTLLPSTVRNRLFCCINHFQSIAPLDFMTLWHLLSMLGIKSDADWMRQTVANWNFETVTGSIGFDPAINEVFR